MKDCPKCRGSGAVIEYLPYSREPKLCPCVTEKLDRLTKAVKYGLHVMMPEIHAQRTCWPGEVDNFEDLAKAALEET